ncbi:MAG: peptidase inhibitor family I36 protein [Nocardioidaceae bacterium]
MNFRLPRHHQGMNWKLTGCPMLVAAAFVASALPIAPARASARDSANPAVDPAPVSSGSVAELLALELERDPVGVVVGNEIYRPDGTVFVAVDAGTLSLSQCTSGRWCMWEQASYQGSFSYRTGSGVTYALSGTVHSVYNNRSNGARLFSNSGASSTCYDAGDKSASLAASYQSAEKVRLLAGAC